MKDKKLAKKRKQRNMRLANKILFILNAVLSIITLFIGVLLLLAVEISGVEVKWVVLLGLTLSSIIAIIQEINTMVFRRDKRSLIIGIPLTAIYLAIIIVDLAVQLNDYTIFTIVLMAVYVTIRLGKLIYIEAIDRRKGFILRIVLFSALIIASIIFISFQHSDFRSLANFMGIFFTAEGLIFVGMSLISGDSAKRIVRILWKTHVGEVLLGLFIFMVLASLILTLVESEKMPTVGDAMWYCFATVTTIGFGDITALTFPGRIITVLLGIYGIVVVALFTSVIVTAFNDTVEEQNMKKQNELEAKEKNLMKRLDSISDRVMRRKPEESVADEEIAETEAPTEEETPAEGEGEETKSDEN